jgi:hypothetical protein
MLPPEYSEVPVPDNSTPTLQSSAWVVRNDAGETLSTTSLLVFSSSSVKDEAENDMPQLLGNFLTGMTGSSGNTVGTRGSVLTSQINGLSFTQFAFDGTNLKQKKMQGVVAGAVDGHRVIIMCGTGFGDNAEGMPQLFNATLSTLKRR